MKKIILGAVCLIGLFLLFLIAGMTSRPAEQSFFSPKTWTTMFAKPASMFAQAETSAHFRVNVRKNKINN